MPIQNPRTDPNNGLTRGMAYTLIDGTPPDEFSDCSPVGSVVIIYRESPDSRGRVNYYGPNPTTGELSSYWALPSALAPLVPVTPRNDARSIRAKLNRSLDNYRSIENPTVAVRSIIEELEGALSL